MPLTGYTVAVAGHARQENLTALLEAAGARVVVAQAVRVVAQVDVDAVYRATLACVAAPLDDVVVATGLGFRAWVAAARRGALGDPLLARLRGARLLVRDAATADALRTFGLRDLWSTPGGTVEELFRYLLAHDSRGRRVAVQLATAAAGELCEVLREAGADVVEVPTYRTLPPVHSGPMRRLNEQIIRGHVDAIAFGSEPAAGGLFAQAAADGQTAAVVEALRANVTVACLGRRAAEVLGRAGVPAIRPGSPETDQLARTIVDSLRRTGLRLHANGHELEIRRHAVVVDGRPIPISPAPIAVLRALAEQPGRVLSRAELHQAMPSWPEVDEHAIEMAVSRLRTALADTGLIQTVMKRGYRLAV